MRITRTNLGDHAALNHFSTSMRFAAQGAPLSVVAIGRVRSGSVWYGGGHAAVESRPGDVFIADRDDGDWQADVDGLATDIVTLDPRLLAQVAATSSRRRTETVRFTGRQASAQAAARWKQTLTYVLGVTAESPGPADSALYAASVAQLLAATALAVFSNDALLEPAVNDAHPVSLRRAVAFIDENAHRPITPTDVAAAAHVTIRTLQLAFRRYLDTTPGAYLRKARLDHVRQALECADPATTTVMEVAGRWGFVNHSRFTAGFRAAYGVTPSTVLRDRD